MMKSLRLIAALLIAVCSTAKAQTSQTVTLGCNSVANIKAWTGLTSVSTSGGTTFDAATYQGLTVTATHGSTETRFWRAKDLRVYASGGSLTFSVPAGGAITEISFTGSKIGLTANTGLQELNSNSKRWAPDAGQTVSTVTFTATVHNQFTSIDVTYTLPDTGGTQDPALAFSPAEATATLGQVFAAPALTNPYGVSVRYESEDSRVATVDDQSGEVTIVAQGTTVIKAISTATSVYASSTVSYTLHVVAPTITTFPYVEPFTTGIGYFASDGQRIATTTPVWNISSRYGAVGSGYVNNTRYDVTNALFISPEIDLASLTQAWVYFEHYVYMGGSLDLARNMQKLLVRKVGETNWTPLNIPRYSITEYVNSGDIDLSAYVGHKIQLAFAYNSTTSEAPNWEIKNFVVSEKPQRLVKVGSTGYATYYYGAEPLVVPAGVEASTYMMRSLPTKLLVQSHVYVTGDVIPAGTAVVLQADPNTEHLFAVSYGDAGIEDSDSQLEGSDAVFTPTNDTDYYYYKLTTKNGANVGFYWAKPDGSAFANGAHKAYLKVPKSVVDAAGVKDFLRLSDDTATSITSALEAEGAEAPRYNVAGQRVGAGYRGLVIQGGKKVMQ